jgi:periplasmic divalent cation tolerance protein
MPMVERSEDILQVFTAVDDEAIARRIAWMAVEKRLAACAQVLGPSHSAYWWQGAIEAAEEWLVLLKTRSERYPELEAALREWHPYSVPEILALPVVSGNPSYLEWLRRETRPSQAE